MSEGGTLGKLVHEANQIAHFFRHKGHETAVKGVADHIKAFWDPRMRRLIFAHMDEADGAGLDPIAHEAVVKLQGASPQALHADAMAAGAPSPGPSQGDDAG